MSKKKFLSFIQDNKWEIIDMSQKIILLIILLILFNFIPSTKIVYQRYDENRDPVYTVAYYNLFGIIIGKQSNSSIANFPCIYPNYLRYFRCSIILFVFGKFSSFFIGNVLKHRENKYRSIKSIMLILSSIGFLIIGILINYNNYSNILTYARECAKESVFPQSNPEHIYNLEYNFNYVISFILIAILIELVIYDQIFKKSNIVIKSSDLFWTKFIRKAMKMEENKFFDFKITQEMWKAPDPSIKAQKKREFCEKVASFANAEGGIIIIGITDKIPREIAGLSNLEYKTKSLESAIKKFIDYKKNFVSFKELLIQNSDNVTKSCLILIIHQTKKALGVLHPDNKYSFPIRIGGGTEKVNRESIEMQKASLNKLNVKLSKFLDDF